MHSNRSPKKGEKPERTLEGCRVQSEFCFELDSDPSRVTQLVDYLTDHFRRFKLGDEQDALRISVCLFEAITNAVNHGNFELDSELRQSDDDQFDRLVRERRSQLPYSARHVFVEARLSPSEASFIVRDEGAGFNHRQPSDEHFELERIGGRGLLLIRAFMDEVRHNERGNEITMVKRRR